MKNRISLLWEYHCVRHSAVSILRHNKARNDAGGRAGALIKNNNKVITASISSQTSQVPEFNNRVELDKFKKDSIGIEQANLYWKKSS